MNIFLATTCYDHKVWDMNHISILKNCVSLMRAGHFVIPYPNNDLYIDRSRNLCVNIFLDTDCEELVFVDADLEFDDDAILKLLKHDKDIVVGAYRYKKPQEEYPIILKYDSKMNCKDEQTGLVSATRVPTGLMRIKRSVFNRMREHYNIKKDERDIYQFFETGIRFENDPNWYGEDSFFCKRWEEMDGEIWVEPNINFTHYGTIGYKGNYHEYLMNRRVDQLDAVKSGVPGWMTDNELTALKFLASQCQDVVEIGSWKGRSTKELLESCKGTVYAVDHWQGSTHDLSKWPVFLTDIFQEFMNNVGHYSNLIVLRGDSLNIANQFNGNKADLVFIDAGHTYEECKADIEAWLPKCNKIIAGHDYSDDYTGVKEAVTEKFGKVNLIDSLWWTEVIYE